MNTRPLLVELLRQSPLGLLAGHEVRRYYAGSEYRLIAGTRLAAWPRGFVYAKPISDCARRAPEPTRGAVGGERVVSRPRRRP